VAPLSQAFGQVAKFRHHTDIRGRPSLQHRATSTRPDLHTAGQFRPQLRQAIEHLIGIHQWGERQGNNVDLLGGGGKHDIPDRGLCAQGNTSAALQGEEGLNHQEANAVRLGGKGSQKHPRPIAGLGNRADRIAKHHLNGFGVEMFLIDFQLATRPSIPDPLGQRSNHFGHEAGQTKS